ncbi:MAG: hypothetical protein M1530_03855 [Candidatus Marsarchaeota archaeon]|nr:hypothetical protein [Candidatus Marsarchaeota archaeon]
MASLECEKCRADINSYKERVQVLDPIGFTHTFCKACGEDYQKKIEASNASIAETGKLGHLSGGIPRGSSVRF